VTTLTDTQVVTASGGLVELGYSQITSGITIDNGTAGTGKEIIAPLTVVCDGSPVWVEFYSPDVRASTTVGDSITFSLFQDGSEALRGWGNFVNALSGGFDYRPLHLVQRVTPTAGTHTFGVKAYVTAAARTGFVGAGAGTSTTASPAFLRVSKIVQATQWPAVTTGTIICTSTTRPASPFEGQTIYETDTATEYLRSGGVWLPVNPAPNLRIKAGAAQTGIASGTWTKLTFPSATVTNPYGFTVSSGAVTIPSGYGGVYAVQAQVQWDANTSGDRILAFGANNTGYLNDGISGQTSPSPVAAYFRSNLSGLIPLTGGSSYVLWGLQGSGGNRATETSFMENWLSLVKVA
jgi:hypothetical protein